MNRVDEGLALLGWYSDSRATSEDKLILEDLADEALALSVVGQLGSAKRVNLSLRAHEILRAGLLDFGERAALVTFEFPKSKYVGPDIRLIDESLLAFYRGYETAALGLLFVVLERSLRRVLGWTPDRPKPGFRALVEAVDLLPPGRFKDISRRTIEIVYEFYDPNDPPVLLLNRHGLHHGLRGASDLDEMNFARLIGLFDTLVGAELGRLRRGFERTRDFEVRYNAYSSCIVAGAERLLLGYAATG